MYYNRKKELLKSGIIIALILFIAVYSTYHIYYKFKDERNLDYDSVSLDVSFHEKNGDKITLNHFAPVTDAVGLSSTAYTLTVTNKTSQMVKYKIKLVDDTKEIEKDGCQEQLLPKDFIRVSIKKNNLENEIYTISDLEDGVLVMDNLAGLEKVDYVVRVWVSNEASFLNATTAHYHSIIQVIENDSSLAVR